MYMTYLVVHFTMVHHIIIGISLIWYEIQTDNKNLLINNSYYSYWRGSYIMAVVYLFTLNEIILV